MLQSQKDPLGQKTIPSVHDAGIVDLQLLGSADTGELETGIANIPAELVRPAAALADSGYADTAAIQRVRSTGMDFYVSVRNEAAQNHRRYDYRPEPAARKEPKEPVHPALPDMRDKIRTKCKASGNRCARLTTANGCSIRKGLNKPDHGIAWLLFSSPESRQRDWINFPYLSGPFKS